MSRLGYQVLTRPRKQKESPYNMLKSVKSALVLLFLLGATSANASDMGEIKSQLGFGDDGVWDQQNDGRFYVMKNDTKPNAIKYYLLPTMSTELGKRRIHVDVEIRKSGEATHGGLIFGFNAKTKAYYLFTLSQDGIITLMQRTPDGAKVLFKGKGKNIKDGRNTLSYVERGKHVHLAVNGESGLGSDTFDLGDGGAGIVAWGAGEFAFTKFRKFHAIPKNSDISSLLRPDQKSKFEPKAACELPKFGAPIKDLKVAGQIPHRLDLPPQNILVGLDLTSEGKGDNGAGNFSIRQLPNLPDGGIQPQHICSGIETQRVVLQEAGKRAGTMGTRILPSIDLQKSYPKTGQQIEKSGRFIQTKSKRFAAYKTFDNDEAILRSALSNHPMVNKETSIWTMPGWILMPLNSTEP